MTTHEALYRLSETKRAVIRKETMRRNRIQINRNQPILTAQQKRQLPMLEPDFGMRSNKPYIFYCSIFGFETILNQLKIKVL